MKSIIINLNQKEQIQKIIDFWKNKLSLQITFQNKTEFRIDFGNKINVVKYNLPELDKTQNTDHISLSLGVLKDIILKINFAKLNDYDNELHTFAKAVPDIEFISYWDEHIGCNLTQYFSKFSSDENLVKYYKEVKCLIKDKIKSKVFVVFRNKLTTMDEKEIEKESHEKKKVDYVEIVTKKRSSLCLLITRIITKDGREHYNLGFGYPHFVLPECINICEDSYEKAVAVLKSELKNRGYEIVL